jgi:prephenate dehydratase
MPPEQDQQDFVPGRAWREFRHGLPQHVSFDMEPLPCPTFEDAFNAVETGKADLAMIPIENTIAGRVADIHHLLPESKLHIVGEYFLPIHFHLMVLPGVKRADIKTVTQPYPCAWPVPQIHPQERLEGDGRRRHGRRAAEAGREKGDRTMAALIAASLAARALRPRYPRGGMSRTPRHPTSPVSSC